MDQNQMNQMGGIIAGFFGVILLFVLAFTAFWVFIYWRILKKAGLEGPLALLILVPGIGYIIVLCILAFSEWKVVPAPQQVYGYPPPPPTYPTAPPTQL